MHWAKNCPHKTNIKLVHVAKTNSDDDNYDEQVNIILMSSEHEILINEMDMNAITDTACRKTVSGGNWFHNHSVIQGQFPSCLKEKKSFHL